MPPRLIVFDIDGTLIGHDSQVSPRTLRAIQRAREQGAIIALASGRRLQAMLPFARLLEISVPLICMNGALVVDSDTQSPLSITNLDPGIARRAVAAMHDLSRSAFVYHYSLTPPDVYYQLAPSHPAVAGYITHEKGHVRQVDDLLAQCEQAIRVLTFGSADEVDPVREMLEADLADDAWILPSIHLGLSHLEIYSRGVSKGRALRRLAGDLSIPLSDVMAFGDGPNDLDLLEVAGTGVAMGNGVEEAKRIADMVTAPQDEDGIAQVLEVVFR